MKRKIENRLPEEIIRAIIRNNVEEIEKWLNTETVNLVDKEKRSAIFYAILNKSTELVSLFLLKKPNLNIKDKGGWTPLHYAAQSNLGEIAKLLIDNGADVESKDDYGNTPLWRAVFAFNGKGDIIKLLLNSGADINNKNDSGISPIELAETIANYNIIQFFRN